MPSDLPSIDSAFPEPGNAPGELAARVASGPGFWTGWLAELSREGLLEALLAEDVIARALAEAPTSHKHDRVLGAKMTMVCVLVACLFPGGGYDVVLARTFGLPGLGFKPGTEVPAGSAFSQARKLLGEHAMRRLFELDAERPDAEPGITARGRGWRSPRSTAPRWSCPATTRWPGVRGARPGRTKPKLRVAAHVRTASRRWIAAAVGGYLDGENTLADELE